MAERGFHDVRRGLEWQWFMRQTGYTDQARGRQYQCPRCRRRFWSAFGHARKHFESQPCDDQQQYGAGRRGGVNEAHLEDGV